jgi:prepilin-type N-terminal cleavage/methylation domain-containing protein
MKRNSRGFTIIEMMISVVVLSIILAALFSQLVMSQQRNATEQVKIDLFQETREFIDQMTRDLHQAGFPNTRNFGPGQLGSTPANSSLVAVGLVKVASDEIIFEGDVTGTGVVSTVDYKLEPTGPNCPCLKRSVNPKAPGVPGPTPIGGQSDPIFQVEVQNVANDANTPIFTAYQEGDANTPVTLPTAGLIWNPADAPNQALLGKINTIKVNLVVQGKISQRDGQTHQTPTSAVVSTIRLNNCSLAGSGGYFDCSYN